MGDKSEIHWTDATWNPTIGCTKVSAGCTNCYAIRGAYKLANGFGQEAYKGLTVKRADGSMNWTGEVRALEERLLVPLRWKRPRRIFVDSMSDMFHEQVPAEFIVRVYAVMALAKQHTFQMQSSAPRPGQGRELDGQLWEQFPTPRVAVPA